MRKHTKVYLQAMGYDITDFIPCEICQSKAVDIHHIESRGMGGSKTADTIENLMALCRTCHVAYGDIKEHKERLQATHNHHLAKRVI
jgi:5-methylcytosine-specific restriction endonuclease McrA